MPPAEQDQLISSLSGQTIDATVLTTSEVAALVYTGLLTRTPWLIEQAHVDAMRSEGFDDRALHDICAIVSYFAFVNRIADGLGVELER